MNLLKRNKKQQDSAPRVPNKQIQRPEPYRYHAVRSSTERRSSRGNPQSVNNRISVKFNLEKLATVMFLGVLSFSFLYLFWVDTSPRLKVAEGETEAILLRDMSEYNKGAQELLQKSIWSRSKLTLNTEAFSRDLKTRFPELATVTVSIPLSGHKPVVTLQAKEPKLLVISGSTTYILDYSGVVIARLSDLTEGAQASLANLLRVEDKAEISAEDGRQLLTTETVTFLLQADHQYKAAKIPIRNVKLPADKPNEVWIEHEGDSIFVKYIVTRPAREQVGAFIAIKDKLASEGGAAKEYIDVRVPDKVFYK